MGQGPKELTARNRSHTAFEGVHLAEKNIELIFIIGTLFKLENQTIQILEDLFRFFKKGTGDLLDLFKVDHHNIILLCFKILFFFAGHNLDAFQRQICSEFIGSYEVVRESY
ncbi:hypothetical protein D3C87_1702050 [compost metagenome]